MNIMILDIYLLNEEKTLCFRQILSVCMDLLLTRYFHTHYFVPYVDLMRD